MLSTDAVQVTFDRITIPPEALEVAWASLSSEAQAEIGRLALTSALFNAAASTYQGGIVYLDGDGRDEADQAFHDVTEEILRVAGDHLPDLYGNNPSDEHPGGTDPLWAKPMVKADEFVIKIVEEEAA